MTRPTRAEVEALIARQPNAQTVEVHPVSTLEWCNEVAAMLRALIAERPERRDALSLALAFHESYERLAPSFGYETRKDTRAFDPTSQNGKLMVAVCDEMLALIAEPTVPRDIAPDLEPLNEMEQKLLDRLLRSIPKQIEALRAEGSAAARESNARDMVATIRNSTQL